MIRSTVQVLSFRGQLLYVVVLNEATETFNMSTSYWKTDCAAGQKLDKPPGKNGRFLSKVNPPPYLGFQAPALESGAQGAL